MFVMTAFWCAIMMRTMAEKKLFGDNIPETVPRDEYVYVDNGRIMCFFTWVIGIHYAFIGCKAHKAIRLSKPEVAHKVFKKSFFMLIPIIISMGICCHFGK